MLRRGNSRNSDHNDALPISYAGGDGASFSPQISYGNASMEGGHHPRKSKTVKKSQIRKAGSGLSLISLIALVLVLFALIVTGAWLASRRRYRSLLNTLNARGVSGAIEKIKWTEKELADVKFDMGSKTREVENRYSTIINQLTKDNALYRKDRDELKELYESASKKEGSTRWKLRESEYLKQIAVMQTAVRKESRRSVLERFGPGPHEVQLTYVVDNVNYDLVIELAPLNTVPHAIHLFLEQVEHGLWNDTYFFINTEHVLQAGPSSPNGVEDFRKGKIANMKKFQDVRLDKLAFPDYANDYPHDQWTVGFADRPGGPEFYINKLDNAHVHGPGGQIQHVIDEQADACFGRVTKGRADVARLLFTQEVIETGMYYSFIKKQIPIVGAVVLTPKPDSGVSFNLEEIPEPMEIQFGRSLEETLKQYEQSLAKGEIQHSVNNSKVSNAQRPKEAQHIPEDEQVEVYHGGNEQPQPKQ